MNARNLDQLAQRMADLARVPSRLAPFAAPEIARLVQREFAEGRDPYGRPWAKLRPSTVARGRRPPPLTDTRHGGRHMNDGISVKPMPGAGISITFADAVPAIFHQYGTRYMDARQILPSGVMPKEWTAALERATAKAMR